MLVELLRAGTPDLSRRWVAALLLVPESDRAAVVNAVELRIVTEYGGLPVRHETGESAADPEAPMMHIAEDPVAKDGHTEQIIRSYSAPDAKPKHRPGRSSDAKRA